jgi:hypothetical protein
VLLGTVSWAALKWLSGQRNAEVSLSLSHTHTHVVRERESHTTPKLTHTGEKFEGIGCENMIKKQSFEEILNINAKHLCYSYSYSLKYLHCRHSLYYDFQSI